jgi:outer membrane protein assembly factor BamB
MRTRLLLVGIAVLLLGSHAGADDWPQFRGPKRDGVSTEKGLLKEWPKDGLKPVWSFKNAGLGFSSMAIADGKLYTLGTRDKDEVVIALDAVTGPDKGAELWTVKLGPIFTSKANSSWGDGPRSTPTIDGKHLYALGAQGVLVCLDISGAQPKEVWRKNLIEDLGGTMMSGWGYSESPLVDGKHLIVTPGGDQGTLAALDKMTGAVVWRSTELKHLAPYSSVMAADINGERQYIQTSYHAAEVDDEIAGFLNGFAAKNGKLLWSAPITKKYQYVIASSPLIKGNLVYHSAGDEDKICHLFEIGKDNKAKEKYSKPSQKNMKNDHGGVVLIGDHVYGYSDRGWACQEFQSGKRNWGEEEFVGQKSGSTIGANGMLYLYTDKGEIGLAEANPKEFTLISSFRIPELSKFPKTRPTSRSSGAWSHPAIANGYLYLRDAEFIYCYDIRDKK